MNAVAHIYDGGPPPRSDGRHARNTWLGLGIHSAASWWWALWYEALVRKGGLAGGTLVAVAAYLVDYHVAHRRLRPGFEQILSPACLVAVYGALAAGFAAGDRLNRRLDDHQVEDGHKSEERRPAERYPSGVIAPEARR